MKIAAIIRHRFCVVLRPSGVTSFASVRAQRCIDHHQQGFMESVKAKMPTMLVVMAQSIQSLYIIEVAL